MTLTASDEIIRVIVGNSGNNTQRFITVYIYVFFTHFVSRDNLIFRVNLASLIDHCLLAKLTNYITVTVLY